MTRTGSRPSGRWTVDAHSSRRSRSPPQTSTRRRGSAARPCRAPRSTGPERLRRLAGLQANTLLQGQRPGDLTLRRRRHLVAGDADPDEAARLACRLRPPGSVQTRAEPAGSRSCTTSSAAGFSTSASPPRQTEAGTGAPHGASMPQTMRLGWAAQAGRRDAGRLLLDVVVGRPGGVRVHARLAARRAVRPAALRHRHSSMTGVYRFGSDRRGPSGRPRGSARPGRPCGAARVWRAVFAGMPGTPSSSPASPPRTAPPSRSA